MIAQKMNEKILCLHRSTASTKPFYFSLLWRQWKRGGTNLLKIFAALLMLAANSGGVEAQNECAITTYADEMWAHSWLPRYTISTLEGFTIEQYGELVRRMDGPDWWSEDAARRVFRLPNAYSFLLFVDGELIASLLIKRDYAAGVDYIWRARGVEADGRTQHGCMTAIMSSADVDALVSEIVEAG